MPFFNARPHFENRQVVQYMGESIHLSGQTNFDLGGYNTYIYDSYQDFLNGVSGTTFLSLPYSAATDPISGWSNQTVFQPGIIRVIPPHAVFFSGNTNVITATTQEDVTNYVATSFDSQGTIIWKPLSGLTSMSGSCTPNLYVGTIHPCGGDDTVTIEGNLLVRGETISATTIIETETLLVEDNNIDLNYGGDHTSAIGGGITVLSGVSNTQDSTIMTDSNGVFVFNPGLSSPTLSACTAIHTSNIYGCSPITVHDDIRMNSGKRVESLSGTTSFLMDYLSTPGSDGYAMLETSKGTVPVSNQTSFYLESTGYSLYNNGASFGGSGAYLEMDEVYQSVPITTLIQKGSGLGFNGEIKVGLNHVEGGSGVGGLHIVAHNTLDKSSDNLKTYGTFLSTRNSTIFSGTNTYNTVVIAGRNHYVDDSEFSGILGGDGNHLDNVTGTVVIGGVGLTGNTDNTVYVPTLNINSVVTGETVSLLAITSGGTVVQGASMYSDICESCSGFFPSSGLTISTGTTVVSVGEVLTPIEFDCTSPKCCSQWTITYRDNNRIKQQLVTTNYDVVLKYKEAYNAHIRCSDSNNTGSNYGGKDWTVDITSEAMPTHGTAPTSLESVGVVYTSITPTSSTFNSMDKSWKSQVLDTSYTNIYQSDFITISDATLVNVVDSINSVIDASSRVDLMGSTDGYIDDSNGILMAASDGSTITNGTNSSIIASVDSTIQDGVTGTVILGSNGITADVSYTTYTDNLRVTDNVFATTYYGDGSNLTGVGNFADTDLAFTGNRLHDLSGNTLTLTGGTTAFMGSVGVKTLTPSFDFEVGGSFGATSKSFIIPHPTKKDKKLVYGAIEGPEFGVYVRGKITNVIELPEYWTELVDKDSITVQLTGDGVMKSPYVKEIKDNKVYVGNRFPFISPTGFYTIYGERKDIDKIETEIDV